MTESKIDVPIVERKSVLRDQSEITVSTKTVGNESYVLAKQGDQIVGSFAYERTEHGRCDYETDLVQAHVKNNGVGKALIQAFVVPNPCQGGIVHLALNLKGRSDGVELRAYGKAFVQVFEAKGPATLMPGWNSLALDLHALPQGFNYLKVRALVGQGQGGNWLVIKVVTLR